jgi:putative flippase GtrA
MAVLLTNRRERNRFLRFAMVGIFGAVVDFGIFNILTGVFKFPAVWASVLSFLAAVASNFTWNRYWTYPDSRSKRISVQLAEFTIISLIGLAIRTPVFVVLENSLNKIFASLNFPYTSIVTPEFLGHNLALACAVIIVMFWNFFVNRYWTYRDVAA